MKQAASALLGAGFTIAACCAAGLLLLEQLRLNAFLKRAERLPLAFTLGACAIHLLMFVLLAAQAMFWPVPIVLLAACIGWVAYKGVWRTKGTEAGHVGRRLLWMTGVLAAPFLLLYFVNAWGPEHSPDGSTYHLGFVARFLREHGFERITTNFYGMLGQGVELVYIPAFIIGRHSAAALTHLAFGIALAVSIFQFGRRLNMPWVGAAAALLTLLSPVAGLTSSIAYVDVALAAIVFASFYWLELWDREHGVANDAWRLLIPAGLLAGYAYAAKYTAFTMAVYAAGFVLFRARRLKPLLLVTGMIALTAGPWIARNWILYQNPAAPLANDIFRNPHTHVQFEKDYAAYFTHYEVKDRRELPLEVTMRGQRTQGIIGPVFLLLPLGLLALRRRTGRHIWIVMLLLTSTYLANVGTRFLIPSLPFFSLSIAMAVGETPVLLGALMLVHAISSWPSMIPRYASPHAWRLDQVSLKAALRLTPQDEYLRSVSQAYAVARMIEAKVPERQPVFGVSGAADAYTSHDIRVSFQSASNEVLNDILQMGWLVGNQPIRIHTFRFPARMARRMRVVQTAKAKYGEQWNVHELRFYSQGKEISRTPRWRLQAWPMPWDVQMAFDNSPGTRWRSWETAQPGMYVDVDFGSVQTVDEIRLESSSDSTSVRLTAEVENDGQWKALDAQFESIDGQVTPGARRLATYELHRRGIDYILMLDTDFGSPDIREDPEAWALEEIANQAGARLYRSTWSTRQP